MKYINKHLIFLMVSVLLFNGGIGALAMNSGLSTEMLAEEEINTFISNKNIEILTEEPQKRAIVCFDVNDNGMIATGQADDNNHIYLIIYSSDGIFQYGYTLVCAGSFAIEWNEGNINIYFARSDIIATVNREGQIIDCAEVQYTRANNSYMNYILYSNKRTLGDTRYILRNDMGFLNFFAFSYSQLVVLEADGEETIIYDVNSAQYAKYFTTFILVVTLIVIAVVVLVREVIKLNRKR